MCNYSKHNLSEQSVQYKVWVMTIRNESSELNRAVDPFREL